MLHKGDNVVIEYITVAIGDVYIDEIEGSFMCHSVPRCCLSCWFWGHWFLSCFWMRVCCKFDARYQHWQWFLLLLLEYVSLLSYLWFCLDCGSLAWQNGYYSSFTKDIAQCQMKIFLALYRGESYEGVILTIYTWESIDSVVGESIICFKILRCSTLIVEYALQFYNSTLCLAKI